jgi:hypothetical protein
VFLLLRNRAHADHILSLPHCMQDPLTTAFIHRFRAQGLQSDEAWASLCLLALTRYTENIGLEVGHAHVRRLVTAQSVQTHTPTMEFIAAELTCLRLRRSCSVTGSAMLAAARRRASPPVARRRRAGRKTQVKAVRLEKKRTGLEGQDGST